MFRLKLLTNPADKNYFVRCAAVLILGILAACAIKERDVSTGKMGERWELGEVRAAVEEVLAYYGPVKKEARNRFQSARIPSSFKGNLGEEFTVMTITIDSSFPHKVYVNSAVYVTQANAREFKNQGAAPEFEKRMIEEIRQSLRDLNPITP